MNIKQYIITLTIIISLCITIALVGCEEQHGGIKGRVFDEDGMPLAGMTIHAGEPGITGILLRSDEEGYYNISNVHVGEWEIQFFDDTGWLIGLEKVQISAGETITLDFTIGAKPSPSNPYKIIVP